MTRWKANLRLSWRRENHAVGLTGRYRHHVKDDANFIDIPYLINLFGPFAANVDSRTTWDLQYNFRFEDLMGAGTDTMVSVGGLNIFETLSDPLFGRGGIESHLHDPRGRMLYLRLTQEF